MKHSVDVSVSLAEGEAQLMRIKRACEEHGNQVGNGVRLDATGLRDPSAAFLMMVHEFLAAHMQTTERKLVTRKNKCVGQESAS